jgi:hypothetical protein
MKSKENSPQNQFNSGSTPLSFQIYRQQNSMKKILNSSCNLMETTESCIFWDNTVCGDQTNEVLRTIFHDEQSLSEISRGSICCFVFITFEVIRLPLKRFRSSTPTNVFPREWLSWQWNHLWLYCIWCSSQNSIVYEFQFLLKVQ